MWGVSPEVREIEGKTKRRGLTFPSVDLTEGSIVRNLIIFIIPLFLGQLLQQLYNVADAWVVGNFASNEAFAAVSSAGNLCFLIIGLFNGIAIGGGVIISKYYGAKDHEQVEIAVHTNMLVGVWSSVIATVLGLIFIPQILRLMNTPENVMPEAVAYFRVYFGGVCTIIFYNICMSIMRSLGDSIHPLYYLAISSVLNVVMDLLFVAVFHWGVIGASLATVIAQGVSVILCLIQMAKATDESHISFSKMKWNGSMMKEVLVQGLPTGIQNSVISVGNLAIQTSINSFGSYAMAGVGAYTKIEGFAFLPITGVSMAMPTFISQNLGARKVSRAKKGAAIGVLGGVAIAELIGLGFFLFTAPLIRFFVDVPESVAFGVTQAHTTTLFYCLLAFSHCAAGVLRGCGKSVVPMMTMLICWCGVRVVYVNTALRIHHVFGMIAWAYPLTWCLSTIVFLVCMLRMDWEHALTGLRN